MRLDSKRRASRSTDARVDDEIGHRLTAVRTGLTAVRNLRAWLVQLAASRFRPGIRERLSLCIGAKAPFHGIASVLEKLGSLIERMSDRRLRLRWFSREEFARLPSLSDDARATARFVDRSGQARSPETHLRRLEKLAPAGVAIGGVLGAKHYFPDLDLVGVPRLDLSVHSSARAMELGFVQDLDPALVRTYDPLEPATVVIHAVRHADPLFNERKRGLAWADPIECLLDLHEARLDALQQRRPAAP